MIFASFLEWNLPSLEPEALISGAASPALGPTTVWSAPGMCGWGIRQLVSVSSHRCPEGQSLHLGPQAPGMGSVSSF